MNLKEKFNKHSLRSHAGLWLMLVAILAMESIACVQYFYTRATIKADAVYRAVDESLAILGTAVGTCLTLSYTEQDDSLLLR